MRTSLFALVAAAYMASSTQAIALDCNTYDLVAMDELSFAQQDQDEIRVVKNTLKKTGNRKLAEQDKDDIKEVKDNLTHTVTKQGVTKDPKYNEERAVAAMKEEAELQRKIKLGLIKPSPFTQAHQ